MFRGALRIYIQLSLGVLGVIGSRIPLHTKLCVLKSLR
jgi:hypothetical protein